MARLTKEALRALPIFLLEKLLHTSNALLWDVVQLRNSVYARLEEPQIMFTEPELIHERDRLNAEMERLSEWHSDLTIVLRERRTVFQRLIDDPLDPDAPTV